MAYGRTIVDRLFNIYCSNMLHNIIKYFRIKYANATAMVALNFCELLKNKYPERGVSTVIISLFIEMIGATIKSAATELK
jgi:hypothetical protein